MKTKSKYSMPKQVEVQIDEITEKHVETLSNFKDRIMLVMKLLRKLGN